MRVQDRIGRSRECSISPKDDGPLLVTGPVKLVDRDGNEYEVDTRNLALCRCGASEDKPFCDGSHKDIRFQAVNRATDIERAEAS
jgi:CDGSH-type Zn-finger protein